VEFEAAGMSDDEDEWLFGGQFFLDLIYKSDQFFCGINAKYQITEDGDDVGIEFSNWRVGGLIGVLF
jgi:hypothetical protein